MAYPAMVMVSGLDLNAATARTVAMSDASAMRKGGENGGKTWR